MNPLVKALSYGYTAEQVLGFLSRKSPQMGEIVSKAHKYGYKPKKILGYIANSLDDEDYSQITPYEISEQRGKANNKKLAIALGAFGGLTAYALKRAAPSIAARALAQQSVPQQTRADQTTSSPPIVNPQTQANQSALEPPQISNDHPITNAMENQVQSPPAQEQENVLMKGKLAKDLIDKLGIEKELRQVASGKTNTAQDVAAYFEKMRFTPEQKKILKSETKTPFAEIIGDYLSQNPNENEVKTAVEKEPLDEIQEKIKEPKEVTQEQKNPEKSVFLPNGDIGKIISEKNGIAKLDVDGEIKHRKVSDLNELPVSSNELADLYERLTNAIPEQARSAVINFAGYDPSVNELAFRPHGGALYVYKDIPKEFADQLRDSMFQAKTTGQNFYGSWAEGEASRFAGLGKLIRELQKVYGGRGKEYIRKYETVHDFLALPEAAKKEKNKKKKK